MLYYCSSFTWKRYGCFQSIASWVTLSKIINGLTIQNYHIGYFSLYVAQISGLVTGLFARHPPASDGAWPMDWLGICNKLSTFPFCKCEFLFIIDHESQVIAKRA